MTGGMDIDTDTDIEGMMRVLQVGDCAFAICENCDGPMLSRMIWQELTRARALLRWKVLTTAHHTASSARVISSFRLPST
jgi:hypothetical protein